MTDYTELVKALRHCTDNEPSNGDCCNCPYQGEKCHTLLSDAAAAIEDLQAELEKKRTADCWGCKCEKLEPSCRLQKRGKPVLLAALPMNECEKLEPKRGEWIGVSPMVDTVQCSACGGQLFSAELETPYCPYCGAEMKEDQE